MRWSGRTVLVTGASSGIGRAVAEALVGEGARVGLLARSGPALEEVADRCRARAGRTLVLPADVADADEVRAAVDRLADGVGIDAVVHAAGVVQVGAFEDVPTDLFEAVVRTNLHGTATIARATLPWLEESRGVLVVLGSMLGEVPGPLMSAYVASKHGVHGLVRTLQAERGRRPPRIVLVQPAAVRTPIYRKAGTLTGARGAPVPPVLDPERVAAAVLTALEEPRRTLRIGALNGPAVLLHRLAPRLYDPLSRQLATRFGLDVGDPVPPTPGAVLDPIPAEDAVAGPPVRARWRSVLGGGPRRFGLGPRGNDRS